MAVLPLSPQITAPELANLSLSRDAQVRAAAAGHPNTSPYILGELAAEFPAEVLGNPALPLLRLAEPGFTRHWPLKALLALVTQADVPAWLRRQALTHPKTELQVALARHPLLSIEELERLARHPAWLVRACIAARADLTTNLRQTLMQDSHYGVRLTLATRHDLLEEELQEMKLDSSRFVRQEVMRQRKQPT